MSRFYLPRSNQSQKLAYCRLMDDATFISRYLSKLDFADVNWNCISARMISDGESREYHPLRTKMTDLRMSMVTSQNIPGKLHALADAVNKVAPNSMQFTEGLQRTARLLEKKSIQLPDLDSVWAAVPEKDEVISRLLSECMCQIDLSLQRAGLQANASAELFKCLRYAYFRHFNTMNAFTNHLLWVSYHLDGRSTKGDMKNMKLILIELAEYIPVYGWHNCSEVQAQLRQLALLDGTADSERKNLYFCCMDLLRFKLTPLNVSECLLDKLSLSRYDLPKSKVHYRFDELLKHLEMLTMRVVASDDAPEVRKLIKSFLADSAHLNTFSLKGLLADVCDELQTTNEAPKPLPERYAIYLLNAAMEVYSITRDNAI